MKVIITKPGDRYLGHVLKELPSNTILDKGMTGIGATTLEIEADRHSIIAVPFVNMIKNKGEQHSNIIRVYGDMTSQDIQHEVYLKLRSKSYVKIMVTYDSLYKLLEISAIDVTKECFLLIDEYHILLLQYMFRNKAIVKLLELAKKFENVCYMSATSLTDNIQLEELKDLPVLRIDWPHFSNIKIHIHEAKYVKAVIRNMIEKRIKGKEYGNYHIFYNSVYSIAQIIRKLKMDPNNVKVVCRDSPENRKKLSSKYPISKNLLEAKLINFYTSTAFEGCDIYDTEGRIFIVSDPNTEHTMNDIAITIPQICGRIRNSKYIDEIYHICSPTNGRYTKHKNLDSFIEYVSNTEIEGKEQIVLWDMWPDIKKERAINDYDILNGLCNIYLRKNLPTAIYEPNFRIHDIHNYMVVSQMYSSKIAILKEHEKNGFVVSRSISVNIKEGRKISFETAYSTYCILRDIVKPTEIELNTIDKIELYDKLVADAYKWLSPEKVRAVRYRRTAVNKAIERQKKLERFIP
mgnify:CR=1 FL=1